MIIDTSALIAIMRTEDDAEVHARAMENAEVRRMSAASYLECAIVVDESRDPVASRKFDDLLRTAEIEMVPVTATQARIARDAYRDFGKGSGHPAGLDFGDCLSYAAAKEFDEPLLFKGNDFVHTDVTPALPR